MAELTNEKIKDLRENHKSVKYQYFSFLIYPESDVQKKIFNYLESVKVFKYAYILHDEDKKKEHFHVCVKTPKFQTLGSFISFFRPYLPNGYAEGVSNVTSLLLYFLHMTPEAIEAHKKRYPLDALKGDYDLLKIIRQNSHFVQLRDFMEYARSGCTPFEALEDLNDRSILIDPYIDYMEKHSYIFGIMYNYEYNKLKEKEKKERFLNA